MAFSKLLVQVLLFLNASMCSAFSGDFPLQTIAQLAFEPSGSVEVAVATSAFSSIDSFWQTSPYTAAAIACGTKASLADMVAQKNTSNGKEVSAATIPSTSTSTDYKRNLAFILYGSLYQGISQEFIYNHLYPLWFGSGNDIPIVLTKVGFDLLVQTTLVTLPMAYTIKGILFGDTLEESFKKYLWDIQNQQLLQKYFTLWGPVQCLTFSVIPEHYRVTFIALVSFFWLILLSNISCNTNSSSTTNK